MDRFTEWAESHRDQMVGLLEEFIAIESLPGDEHRLAAAIKSHLDRAGVDEVWIDGIGNVVARIRGRVARPALLYNGHMDHVGPGIRERWQSDPFHARVDSLERGRAAAVWGRGACDMKGWIASAVMAARALKELRVVPNSDVFLSFVVQEEPGQFGGTRYLFEVDRLEVDFAVVCEASKLNIMLGHRGTVDLRVAVHGRIGHAAIAKSGENAISLMARLIPQIEAMIMPSHPVLGEGSLCIRRIECSEGVLATVPDTCTISILRKIVPGETCEGVLEEFRKVVQAACGGAPFEVKLTKYFPPLLVGERDPAVQPRLVLLSQIAHRITGRKPALSAWQFGTDGSYIHEIKGIPTVGLGPGDERYAHTPCDHVLVQDLVDSCAIYASFAVEFQ